MTRIRQRWGVEIFQRFFERVVDLCQEAGLVWGKALSVEATKVAANADLDSLVPRASHETKTHGADLFPDAVPTEEAARWVATADTSPHLSGDAIDIGRVDVTAWLSNTAPGKDCARSPSTSPVDSAPLRSTIE